MKPTNIYTRAAESTVFRLCQRFPVVGIVGPRQVGKTTLARRIAEQLPKTVLYLDMEYPEDHAALQNPTALLERHADQTVIIDEVQRMPGLFPVLRALVDRKREPGRFILLGSASPQLIQQSSESLAGRIAYHEMAPFAFTELPEEVPMETHWLRGGFPESLFDVDETGSLEWRRQFVKTYLERDLPLIGLNADPLLLGRLWTMLAHVNGNLINKSTLTNSLGIHTATLQRYMNFFESAYLIRTLQPFIPRITKRLVKSPKVYLRDTGILHYLLNIRTFKSLLGNPLLGASWEAYVLNQIAFHLPDGYEMFFYRTHEGTEADIVLTNGGIPEILVEIKYSNTPSVSKGFYIAQEDLGTSKNYVLCPIKSAFPLKKDVEAIGLSDIPSIFYA
jgi:predicted AAA+ superfamily ATPase